MDFLQPTDVTISHSKLNIAFHGRFCPFLTACQISNSKFKSNGMGSETTLKTPVLTSLKEYKSFEKFVPISDIQVQNQFKIYFRIAPVLDFLKL